MFWSSRVLVVAAIVGGLVVRAALLTSGGTHDVPYDVAWGLQTNAAGFAHYYYGNYFPLQYHVFQLAAWSSNSLGIGGPTALKAINLVADAATAGVLLLIASRLGLGLTLPLGYWLAPYVIVMDWLGYVDFEMAFFALLAVLLIASGRSTTRLIAAGFSLGAAMMMKPQALTLLAVLAGLFILGLVWSRRKRALVFEGLLLAVGPLTLFLLYSAWLASAGRGIGFLARTMVDFGRFQAPALTANMTNVWMVLAQAYRHSPQAVYSVTGPHYETAQAIAAITTTAVVLLGVALVARRIDVLPLHVSVIAVFAFGAMSLPSIMTRAHENHFFLGAVSGLAAAGVLRSRASAVAVHVCVAMQAITLFSVYELGETGPHPAIANGWQAFFLRNQGLLWSAAGAISFAAYCAAMLTLFRAIHRHTNPLHSPTAATQAEVALLQARPDATNA